MDSKDSMIRLAQHSRFRAQLPWSMSLALFLMLLLVSSAAATTLTMSATDAPSVSVTLNGTDQTVADPFNITVADTRTVNDGWKLQITSTTFTTGDGKTLSTTAASITGASVACNSGSCTDPSNSISYPVIVPAGVTAPAPVSFFNAASMTGVGDFTITPTYQVQVPANAFVGTYSSTITITIASGP